MGLFGDLVTKAVVNSLTKDAISVPRDSLNINCKGKSNMFLETENGFITRETYTPDNMDKVTAICIGGTMDSYSYNVRIDIHDILEIESHIDHTMEPFTEKIGGLGCPWKVVITTKDKKKYKFDVIGDVCSAEEFEECVRDKSVSDRERYNRMLSTSCIFCLGAIVDFLNENANN